MLLDGSPEWQRYIFIAATIFLIWEVWRGWRLGAVRGLLRLAALFCAWIGGSTAAGATGTIVAFFSKVPPLIAPGVAGLTVGIGIYIGISLLAGLLFKKTEHHKGVVRWGFGLGGAVCGFIFGLLFLWAGITLIRGLGACGELRIMQARNEGRSAGTEKAALFLIKLKESLELGTTGKSLKRADPLPTAFYDNIVKISMVAGDQQALERFCQYPETLKIIANPKVAAIIQDPALEKAAEKKNILPLLQNKNVQAAANDPHLLEQLKAFDLTAALDFALTPEVKPANGSSSAASSQRSPRKPARAKSISTTPPAKASSKTSETPSKPN
ncbi:MAG: CvpA family protein [Verrucomicrobia bacterium]|nr:CvpA family protein [Verrucomicrobiota bacterium]